MNRKKSFANLLKITCVMVCSCIGTQLVWADKTNSESITDFWQSKKRQAQQFIRMAH